MHMDTTYLIAWLAHQLDELVKNGFLKDYLQDPQNDQSLVTAGEDQGNEVPIHGEINTISRGFFRRRVHYLPIEEVRARGNGGAIGGSDSRCRPRLHQG